MYARKLVCLPIVSRRNAIGLISFAIACEIGLKQSVFLWCCQRGLEGASQLQLHHCPTNYTFSPASLNKLWTTNFLVVVVTLTNTGL